MRGRLLVLVGGVTLGCTGAWAAWAAGAPAPASAEDALLDLAGEKLELRADRLDLDFDAGRAELRGDVQARLGPLRLEAPEVSLRYQSEARVSWVRARGGVTARVRDLTMTAPAVVVDLDRREARFSGGVKVRRRGAWVRAGQAVLHLDTRKLEFERVRGAFPLEFGSR